MVALVGTAVLSGIAIGIRSQRAPPVPVAPPPTNDRLAYDRFLQARFILNQETHAALQTAARHLEQAVARDSQFAQAYGTLALVYALTPGFGKNAPNDDYPRAQAAALRALEIDPGNAEATRALAHVSAYFHWDWREGERLFQRSLALAPDDASARVSYGDFLSASGQLRESIAEYERALVLDPSSRRARNNLARRLIWLGQHDRAMAELLVAIELEPGFARAHRTLGLLYVQLGRYTDAIAELSKARDLGGHRPFDLSALADAYVRAGRRPEAEQILRTLEERERREFISPFAIATILVSLGRFDEAFAWLDRAADAHDATLAWTVLHDAMLDPIRSDPRFDALLRRMRLPP